MVLFAFCSQVHAGDIVKWVDKTGVTHYSNVAQDRNRSNSTIVTPPKASSSQASVYKFLDARGVTHYTDRRPAHQNYVVISTYCPACDPKSPINWSATKLNTQDYMAEIDTSASRWGVDPALIRAIVHAESAFRPTAVSKKGAQGLMQLMPAVADSYGVKDPFNPVENIDAGAQHLAGLLKRYAGDIRLTAAAYNAGAGAVARYGGVPPYEETRVYVERVSLLQQRYKNVQIVSANSVSAVGGLDVQSGLRSP